MTMIRSAALGVLIMAGRAMAADPTIEVCPTCEMKSLRAAIEAAALGATIHLAAGVYSEDPITIAKTLSIIGEKGAVLDGQGKNQIITILKADGVKISGLTIQNSGLSFVQDIAGIRVTESSRCVLTGNRLLNNTYGIYLENSHRCQVSDNVIIGHSESESSGGNGLHIWYGDEHLIERNSIEGHRDGIYLEFAKGTRLTGNRSAGNLRYGLHFMSSNDTSYEKNVFSHNGAGVAVMYSRRIRMTGNLFSHNSGPAAYGLLLKEVMESEVAENRFEGNTVGIFMEGSNRSRFSGNLFRHSGWALRIMGDCENNSFSGNDFLGNTFEVTTNSDHSWNRFEHNYWSQYDGYDLDRDGVGDRPHRPVSLSSVLLERTDSSYVLMNSFFFAVLDQVERALPGLTPEPLKDEKPSMTPLRRWQEPSERERAL